MGVNDSMKSSFEKKSLAFAIIVLFFGMSVIPSMVAERQAQPYQPSDVDITISIVGENRDPTFIKTQDDSDMKKIFIKADHIGGLGYWTFGHIGPLWLPYKSLQFTIEGGNAEIIVDGEKQDVSDRPVYVYLDRFFGIAPILFKYTYLDDDSLFLFGRCKNLAIAPYSELLDHIYDQPLFNITDVEDLGQTAWGSTSADFNDDGWMDFAVSWATDTWPVSLPDAFISIYYNNKDDSFTREEIYTHDWEEWGYFDDLESGDYDNDGDIDLLFTLDENINQMATNGTIYIIFNNGDNTFTDKILIAKHVSDVSEMYGRFNPQLTTADYDMDGDIDFLVGDNSGMVEFYKNTGNGTFTSAGVIHDFGYLSWGLTSGDFDQDGDIDFCVAAGVNTAQDGYVYLKRNMLIESDGSTVFDNGSGEILFNIYSSGGTGSLQSIDYNNDGKLDIIIGLNYELYLCMQEYDGFEIFPLGQFPSSAAGYVNDIRKGGLTSADYNNDGREDLVTGGVQGNIRVFWNDYSEVLPPLWPIIYQPTGEYDPGVELEFGFISMDFHGNDIFYYIDWGDGTDSGWIGPYHSGEGINVAHVWDEEGVYWVRVKARNTYGAESGWNKYMLILRTDGVISKTNSMISDTFENREKKISLYKDEYYVYRKEFQLPYFEYIEDYTYRNKEPVKAVAYDLDGNEAGFDDTIVWKFL